MGAAIVNVKEIDLSTRVPSATGIIGAICLASKKGRTDVPVLVTSDTDFLRKCTPNETVKVGYDMGHYSALAYLQKSNLLWIQRVINGALFSGLYLVKSSATGNNSKIESATISDPTARTPEADEALFIYNASQGVWGNDIGVKIYTYANSPSKVKEPNAFLIEVYHKDNEATPLETFVCSRVQGAKDGYGRNIFVEDVLESSGYIRAISNSSIDEEVMPKEQSTVLYMGSGSDGSAITESNMVNAANKAFSNTENISITLLLDAGWATNGFQTALDSIAKNRKDCIAVLSVPFAACDSSDYMTEIVNYRKSVLNLNSSYSALYTPHVKITDRFNDRKIWVSPDGYAAGAISETASNYEAWYPVAGFRRGVLNVEDVRRRFSQGECDQLYDAGINPIRFFQGRGIVIWGQKTLSSRPSALDRLNVRMLLITIEPAIKAMLEDFLFELNDEGTRSIIKSLIEAYMDSIQAARGVTDYKVVCDSSNNTASDVDNNRLNISLFIRPTRSIEEINLKVVVTSSSISFEEAALAA